MGLIHWSGTPDGVCERRDSNVDAHTVTQDNGTSITFSARADWPGNVTCPICYEATGVRLISPQAVCVSDVEGLFGFYLEPDGTRIYWREMKDTTETHLPSGEVIDEEIDDSDVTWENSRVGTAEELADIARVWDL